MFSNKAKKYLRKAGWFPGRLVDMDNYLAAVEVKVGRVPDCVRDFMREFGGLFVTHPHPTVRGDDEDFAFLSGDHVPKSKILGYFAKELNQNVYLIGAASNGYYWLLMADNGMVYADMDGQLFFIGHSGKDALSALCSNRPWKQVSCK